jgi:hypothetical protein
MPPVKRFEEEKGVEHNPTPSSVPPNVGKGVQHRVARGAGPRASSFPRRPIPTRVVEDASPSKSKTEDTDRSRTLDSKDKKTSETKTAEDTSDSDGDLDIGDFLGMLTAARIILKKEFAFNMK